MATSELLYLLDVIRRRDAGAPPISERGPLHDREVIVEADGRTTIVIFAGTPFERRYPA